MEKPTEQQLSKLASQLSCPTGEKGIEVANIMNQSNKNLTEECIQYLSAKSEDRILEVGVGNGILSHDLIRRLNKEGVYLGLDTSPLMIEECIKNAKDSNLENTSYQCMNINDLKKDEYFSKFFCVNLIYFIEDLDSFFSSVYSQLAFGAKGIIGIRSQKTLKKLPVTKYEFIDRPLESILKSLDESGFSNIQNNNFIEKPNVKRQVQVDFDFENHIISFEKVRN